MYEDYFVPELDEEYAAEIAAGYYDIHAEQAIEEFVSARLQSFYVENPEVIGPPIDALSKARRLSGTGDYAAALVFAVIGIEVGLKLGFIKAIVYGSVHNETAAGIIADTAASHSGFDRLRGLLFQIISEVGVDLSTYKRGASSKILWEEVIDLQKQRNAIVHRAQDASAEQAELAIAVASALLEDVFPALLTNIGLHLHDAVRICGGIYCAPPALL
jgi:hypothetical protein